MSSFPRSDSISTCSTTGETLYEDAQQFDTPPESINEEMDPEVNPDGTVDTAESSPQDTKNEESNTEQPKQTSPPTYAKQRGYQPEEGECKTFFCSNWLHVLDLPSGGALGCLCCLNCCNSCLGAGVSQAKTVR